MSERPEISSKKKADGEMRRCREVLRTVLNEDARFYETLKIIVDNIKTGEVDPRQQVTKIAGMKPEKWNDIMVAVDKRFGELVKAAQEAAMVFTAESKARLELMLDFYEKFYYTTRYRRQRECNPALVALLSFDDWGLTLKVLKIMANYAKRKGGKRKYYAATSPEATRMLHNIALGYSLNSMKKMSHLEVLKEPGIEMLFQYLSTGTEGKAAGNPSIKIIKLEHLIDSKADSRALAEELAKTASVPKELVPALWYKIRLAKASKSVEARSCCTLTSLLAYIVLLQEIADEQDGKRFLSETELKTTLIADLIQLLKFQATTPDIHNAAIEILVELVDQSSIFRSSMGETGKGLGDEVLRQLGVNLTNNGLLHSMLRDCTSLSLVRSADSCAVCAPSSGTEVLAPRTAESQSFLANLLHFLECALKNYEREDFINQMTMRFWRGIKAGLLSMVNIPVEERYYSYSVALTTQAMGLISMLYKLRSAEQEVGYVDMIINRLDFEINHLQAKEGVFIYPTDTSRKGKKGPSLEERQELCCSLMLLLTSGISQSRPRANIADLIQDEEEEVPSFIGRMRGADMRRRARRAHVRDREEILRRGFRVQDEREPEEEPEEAKVDEEHIGDSVAVSRRVLESKLIDTLTKMYNMLRTVAESRLAYGKIVYSTLSLLTSIISDIPSSIQLISKKSLFKPIINFFATKMIPAKDYFNIVLAFLNSITLQEDGVKEVVGQKFVKNLFLSLVDEELYKDIYKELNCDLPGRQLLGIYSQANNLKGEIVNSIWDLLDVLRTNTEHKITDIAKMLKASSSEKGKMLSEVKKEIYRKCKINVVMISNVFGFISSLVENAQSQEHAKFIDALNAGNKIVASTLYISKLANILHVLVEAEDKACSSSVDITPILKSYLGGVRRRIDPEGSKAITDDITSTIKDIGVKIGLWSSDANLSMFSEGKKPFLNKDKDKDTDKLASAFPGEYQLPMLLQTVQWLCQMAKVLSTTSPKNCEPLIPFIVKMHILTTKEIARHHRTKEIEEAEDNIKTFKNICSCVGNSDDEKTQDELDRYFFGSVGEYYSIKIVSVSLEIRKTLSELGEIPRNIPRYNFDPRRIQGEILKYVGSSAVFYMLEAVDSKEFTFDSKKAGVWCEDNELMILKNIMLINDMRLVLMNDSFSIIQMAEFHKKRGFDKLFALYEQTVGIIINSAPPTQLLHMKLKILATMIIKVYASLINPAHIKRLMTRTEASDPGLDMATLGFSSNESFIASVLAHSIESILIYPSYGPYKTAVRFLAECAQPAFMLFLEVLKRYPNKEAITSLFQGARPRGGNPYIPRRNRRDQDIPPSMVEQMVLMGFEVAEAEEALRRNDLNAEAAVEEMTTRREEKREYMEKVLTAPVATSKRPQLQNLELKNLPESIDKWLDIILRTLYESLYSVSTYRCKYLLYSLIDHLSATRPYKVKHAFALFLNELQTLLFSLDYAYEFTLIPNEEFQVELLEISMTEKLKSKIAKYTREEGSVSEGEFLVLHKMNTLIDVITTFLRLSKTNELLKIMCDNKIGQCLIVVLSKLVQKGLMLPGRKLIAKVLILLTMVYKEVNQSFLGEMQEATMQIAGDKVVEMSKLSKLNGQLPSADDIKKLVTQLCMAIDIDSVATPMLRKIKSKSKKEVAFLTTETVTAVVLLLCHLTIDKTNSSIIMESGIIKKLLELKEVAGCREKIPNGVIIELIFNFVESEELLSKYMRRVVSGVLLSKSQWRKKVLPADLSDKDLENLQKESSWDMDKFINSMGFLVARSAKDFFQICRTVGMIRKEMQKDAQGKQVAKYMISLKKECIVKLIKEASIPIPTYAGNKDQATLAEMLQKAQKDGAEAMKVANVDIIYQILLKIIDMHLESKALLKDRLAGVKKEPQPNYLFSKGLLINAISQVVRVYPEVMGILLSFDPKIEKCRVKGSNLVSFLISSVFPVQYCKESSGEIKVEASEEWSQITTQFIKHLTNENSNLHTVQHRLLFADMRRRIASEIARVLEKGQKNVLQDNVKALSSIYSTLKLLEGLIISAENTVIFPRDNQFKLLQELFGYPKSIVKICAKLLEACNLHSSKSQLIVSGVINTLERITRFTKARLTKKESAPHEIMTGEEIKVSGTAPPAKQADLPAIEPRVTVEEAKLSFAGSSESEGGKHEDMKSEDSKDAEEHEDLSMGESEDLSEGSDIGEPRELQHERSVNWRAEMMPDEEDEDDEEREPGLDIGGLDPFRRRLIGNERANRMARQGSLKLKSRNAELDAVQVEINGEPLDKGHGVDTLKGISQLYERESEAQTNKQIVELIKGEVLGEEENKREIENQGRSRFEAIMQEIRYLGMRDPEEQEQEQEQEQELPEISLFGVKINQPKINELLKNQFIGKMDTQIIDLEEEKLKLEKEKIELAKTKVPAGAEKMELHTEDKKEAKKEEKMEVKQEEKKEDKKEEKKEQRPVPQDAGVLASLISSILSNREAQAPMEEHKPAGTEAKTEVKKEEEKKAALDPALLARRRQELAALIPGLQIEDNNLLLQIDADFLRELSPDMRLSAVQGLVDRHRRSNPTAPASNRGPSEMDPATFIATIADENLRDEILMTASPEFLAALPPEVRGRAENIRHRNMFEEALRFGRDSPEAERLAESKRAPADPIETSLLIPDKKDASEIALVKTIVQQTKKLSESAIESLIRVLYLNARNIKMPINNLFSHLCSSKKHLYKILNVLLFILSKHSAYEKFLQSKLVSDNVSGFVSEMKLSDTCFPPISLYQGMEYNHLTYSVVSLRIFSLFSSLLKNDVIAQFFFESPDEAALAKHKLMLTSVDAIRAQMSDKGDSLKDTTPLTEILALTANPLIRNSERHLETVINFLDELFKKYENLYKKPKKEGDKLCSPVLNPNNIKQICEIFSMENVSEKSCSKIADILMKLSKVDINASTILDQMEKLLVCVCKEAIKDWSYEIKQMEEQSPMAGDRGRPEDTRVEVKFGRIFRLLKRIYDGHTTQKEEETVGKAMRIYINEGDSIDELTPIQSKAISSSLTPNEKYSLRIRESVLNLLKNEFLSEAFNALTELVSVISKKSKANENQSRKSQLLMKLVPSIEGLIIAYDYHFKDPAGASELVSQIKAIREEKAESRPALGYKYMRAYVFYKFMGQNHQSLNDLIRQMSNHTFQTVIKPFILRFPNLLDFENKRTYFKGELRKIRGAEGFSSLRLNVNRAQIFNDSYAQLAHVKMEEMKGRIRVSFQGEDAADAGGVTREWYTTLSRAMFNPEIGLFIKSVHGNTYQPSPNSMVEPHHLNFFKFIGRIIGKALLDGQYLECYFTRALYKTLVGQSLTIQDLQDNDPELYKGLLWMKENDANELDCTFTYSIDYFGKLVTKELIKGGESTKVTNENKQLFIMRNCKAILYETIESQLQALLKGLYEIIPKQLISIFDYREIELLISGLPDIDLLDLKTNTEYQGYTAGSPVIVWFWEVMETFGPKERAEFLQFVTGTSKVPLDGFKSLPGSSGVQRFQIHKVYKESHRLPTAHTCFNQLDLPEYPTKEILHERLLLSIKEGAEFMGLL